MKNLIKSSSALMVIMVLFSIFSGCKLKQKAVEKQKSQEQTTIVSSGKVTSQSVDSSTYKRVDTSKTKVTEQNKSTKTRIIDITIDMDSTGIKLDSDEKQTTRNLVNAALRSAKSLRLRIEEQQSEETTRSISDDQHKIDEGTSVSKQKDESESHFNQSQEKKFSGKEIKVSKDSTVTTNAGTAWIWILSLISLSFFSYKVYQKFKQHSKVKDKNLDI
jgi:hypothetical protein